MTRRTSEEEALIATLAADARERADAAPAPEPEELLDYLAGRLSPEAHQQLERQLAASPEAARMLLDLAELAEAVPPAAGAPADFAVAAGWRDFQARITSPKTAARNPSSGLPRWLVGLAAVFALLSVGLGAWVWRLELERSRPVANLASLELKAGTRAGELAEIELGAGEPLRLVLAAAERCSRYQLELTGPQGKRTITGLERNALGQLTPLVPIEPGDYSLVLFGCEPRRELESHRFRVLRGGSD